MKDFFIKNKITIAIIAIIAVSLFLRLFHLTDWLHFQLDQARDAYLIKDIVEKGPGELPLLGPRAGGSFLRLGPAYYYIMYLLALVANSFHPVVFVLPEILASIAFVLMFYLLARRFFTQNWSLVLTALAATSTFLVSYDRFSWNPNLMPVFSAFTIYAWLKFLEAKRRNDNKKSILWVSLTALAVGFLIQLHFEAFIAIPIILAISLGVFWFWNLKLRNVNLKAFFLSYVRDLGIFLAIILITHAPVILNEYISGGANTKEFFATISEKQDKDELHNKTEKLIQNVSVYPKGFYNVITGNGGVYFPTVLTRPNLNLLCDYSCRENYTPTIFAAMLFLAVGRFFLFFVFKKTRISFLEKKSRRISNKNIGEFEFLILLLAWVIVPWWAFYSISFNLRPRFFLFVAVPFWIIAGLFLREISRNKPGRIVATFLITILFTTNLFGLYTQFSGLAGAEVVDRGNYPEDQIFYRSERYPTTLHQQTLVSQWITEKFQQKNENNDYLFVWAPPYFYRPIMYLLSFKEPEDKIRYFTNYPTWQNASYFAVSRTTDPDDFFRKERPELFNVVDQKSFGTLTAYRLELSDKGIEEAKKREKKFKRDAVLTDPERIKRNCLKKPKPECRFTWGDVFVRPPL